MGSARQLYFMETLRTVTVWIMTNKPCGYFFYCVSVIIYSSYAMPVTSSHLFFLTNINSLMMQRRSYRYWIHFHDITSWVPSNI